MPFYARALSCLLLLSLLNGCQWWQSSDWLTPFQDEEPAATTGPTETEREREVTELIAKGDLALTKDRLSVPASDNALLYYRQALELDPGNPRAQAGIRQVTKRFRKLARIAHDNGNSRTAEKYLQQAEEISGKDNPANRKLRHELQQTPAGQNPRALDQPLREKLETSQKQWWESRP